MAKILLFAGLKERTGKNDLMWDDTPISIKHLKEKLKTMAGFETVDTCMIAVNEVYARDNDMVQAGDTVALIPPVSGG